MSIDEKEQRVKQLLKGGGDHPFSRREFLERSGAGFGLAALTFLLGQEQALSGSFANPLAPKPQHFPAKARSVIWLFMAGGPSHIDTFDPKPLLHKLNGQKMPESFGTVNAQFTNVREAPILASGQIFSKHGPLLLS